MFNMTETETPPKYYKELLWKEKMALFKEYNTINPRSKLWLAVAIFAISFGVAGLVFIIAHLYLDKRSIFILALLFCFTSIIINVINLILAQKRNERFFEWLKNDKNILKNRMY